jgi:hypothetical protein
MIIRDRYIEYAFGGNDGLALAGAEVFAALMVLVSVTIGLSNKAYSPVRIPPEAGL